MKIIIFYINLIPIDPCDDIERIHLAYKKIIDIYISRRRLRIPAPTRIRCDPQLRNIIQNPLYNKMINYINSIILQIVSLTFSR